jgi:hypothetical protein
MSELGFEAYLDQNFQAPIIASFRHPQHSKTFTKACVEREW